MKKASAPGAGLFSETYCCLDVLVYQGLEVAFTGGSHALANDLPALENKDGGNAPHLIAHGGGSVGVHVELTDPGFAEVLGSERVNGRRDLAARAAPGRPKVDHDGCVRLEDFGLPVRI